MDRVSTANRLHGRGRQPQDVQVGSSRSSGAIRARLRHSSSSPSTHSRAHEEEVTHAWTLWNEIMAAVPEETLGLVVQFLLQLRNPVVLGRFVQLYSDTTGQSRRASELDEGYQTASRATSAQFSDASWAHDGRHSLQSLTGSVISNYTRDSNQYFPPVDRPLGSSAIILEEDDSSTKYDAGESNSEDWQHVAEQLYQPPMTTGPPLNDHDPNHHYAESYTERNDVQPTVSNDTRHKSRGATATPSLQTSVTAMNFSYPSNYAPLPINAPMQAQVPSPNTTQDPSPPLPLPEASNRPKPPLTYPWKRKDHESKQKYRGTVIRYKNLESTHCDGFFYKEQSHQVAHELNFHDIAYAEQCLTCQKLFQPGDNYQQHECTKPVLEPPIERFTFNGWFSCGCCSEIMDFTDWDALDRQDYMVRRKELLEERYFEHIKTHQVNFKKWTSKEKEAWKAQHWSWKRVLQNFLEHERLAEHWRRLFNQDTTNIAWCRIEVEPRWRTFLQDRIELYACLSDEYAADIAAFAWKVLGGTNIPMVHEASLTQRLSEMSFEMTVPANDPPPFPNRTTSLPRQPYIQPTRVGATIMNGQRQPIEGNAFATAAGQTNQQLRQNHGYYEHFGI